MFKNNTLYEMSEKREVGIPNLQLPLGKRWASTLYINNEWYNCIAWQYNETLLWNPRQIVPNYRIFCAWLVKNAFGILLGKLFTENLALTSW